MNKERLVSTLWIVLVLGSVVFVNIARSADGDIENLGIAYPVQVVWDAKALVANKSTAIRIFVHSTFTSRVWAEINVTYDFGTQWYLETGPYGNGTPIDPGYNTIYIPGGPASPAHPGHWRWRPSLELAWTKTGWDDRIELTVDPLNKVQETDETNNGCTFRAVEIVKSRQLKILVVPLSCDPSAWLMDLQANVNFLRDTYPVARDLISWTMGERVEASLNAYSYPHAEDLYRRWVRDLSAEARILGYDRVVAVIPGAGSDGMSWSGVAVGMLREPEDRVPVIVSATSLRDKVKLVAHEIGHTYYLWHPHDIGSPVYEATRYWVNRGEYEQLVNNFMSYRSPPHWIDNGRYDSDPKTWIDLTEYGTEVDGTWQWNLFDQLRAIEFSVPVIVLRGLIFTNGTIMLDRSWYRIPLGIPDLSPQAGAPQTGNYTIRMLDNSQQAISQMSFNASFTYLVDMNGTLVTQETDVVPFLFNAPYVNGTRFIQILNATGSLLVERMITENSPTVNVTFPNGGEELKIGANYTITWDANDLDDDDLTYLVSYSPDERETWIPLANEVNQTHYVWNTSTLIAGDKYLIKVIASDGVNTGEDESNGTFTTLDLAPPVISNVTQNPQPDSVQPSQNVTVQANVYDINSGIKNATLSYRYSTNDGATWSDWTNTTMINETENTFVGGVPGFSIDTHVQYRIFAKDNSNNSAVNDNAGEYYVYTVVPEFPSMLALPLLMTATLLSAILLKKRKSPTRQCARSG